MAKPKALFRDICHPDLVAALDTIIDTQMQVLQGMEGCAREILKDHLLDKDSISYFNWIMSCISQMRITLEPQWMLGKEKKYEEIPLPRKKKRR